MYTIKQISLLYNINIETLRKRAYLLNIKPIGKKEKSKAYIYSKEQIYQIVEYKSDKEIIYINRSFKEIETYYIYPSKMNYEQS